MKSICSLAKVPRSSLQMITCVRPVTSNMKGFVTKPKRHSQPFSKDGTAISMAPDMNRPLKMGFVDSFMSLRRFHLRPLAATRAPDTSADVESGEGVELRDFPPPPEGGRLILPIVEPVEAVLPDEDKPILPIVEDAPQDGEAPAPLSPTLELHLQREKEKQKAVPTPDSPSGPLSPTLEKHLNEERQGTGKDDSVRGRLENMLKRSGSSNLLAPESPSFNGSSQYKKSQLVGFVAAAQAVAGVFARRMANTNDQRRGSWSLPMEVVVESMRAYLPKVLAPQLIHMYKVGDTHTREQITLMLEEMTRNIDISCALLPPCQGVAKISARVGHMDGMWLVPDTFRPESSLWTSPNSPKVIGGNPEDSPACILYFHGGAYLTACANSHIRLTSKLAKEANTPLLAVNYRLAPRHSFKDILADAVEAYDWLLARGVPPEKIVLGGDSAGGHLALSLCAHLAQQQSSKMPGGVVAFSPWIDTHISMTETQDSWSQNSEVDYLGFALGHSLAPLLYGDDGSHPFENLLKLSPAVTDLFPPVLIQVGSNEVLLTEIEMFNQKLGDQCTLEIFEGMVHVFQMFDSLDVKADVALSQAGKFVNQFSQVRVVEEANISV